jgi:parvulin-like peptidyl-prolyl isomerase
MWKRLNALCPGQAAWRRLAVAGAAAGVVVLAFCWGRWGAEATAQPAPSGAGDVLPTTRVAQGQEYYARSPVAQIYNNVPVTREDLGEYLIARFGAERVEFLVNRRIMEQVCQQRGIQVTDAEVEAQLVEDLKNMNIARLKDFVDNVLKRFGKTLYEYKEDVIRPKLAMAKMVRPTVVVTEQDIKDGFEARYGEKVKCRMIVLPKGMSDRDKMALWEKVTKSDEEFDRAAKSQFIQALAYKAGEVPPVHKHFGDPNIEQVAYRLKPGEVSQLFEMKQDGTGVILKCEGRVPADTTRRLEDERMALHREITEIKLAQEIPKVFQKLREQADVKVYLKEDKAQQDLLARRTDRLLQMRVPPPPGMAAVPAPGAAPQGN